MVKKSFTEDLLLLLLESMFVYVPLQAFSTGRPGFSISPSCNSFQISCKQVGPESKISTSIDLLKVDLITQFRAHQILHAPPPSPEDNYSEEERFNVNIDEPDPDWNDWSLEVHPSPNSSGQEQSALSFSGAEQAYRGYNQEGFSSFMASSSEFIHLQTLQVKNNLHSLSLEQNRHIEVTIKRASTLSWILAPNLYAWMRNNQNHTDQGSARSRSASTGEKNINMHNSIQQPAEVSSQQQRTQQSPVNFLTSDIEADFELASDASSISANSIARPRHKRDNPEQ
ncbi:uncharacterized protein LOC113282696 isoform X2 [Papaver somniferum]|uniref:uncharacterized protein LOC113282696 isoform X2 n=1 Tax=Papaver somniferum TaxID=3469 RepID=UPI000E7001DD|nr:uncharacterized protein LOC113282696 isoform X2 [Papaver somniferum]